MVESTQPGEKMTKHKHVIAAGLVAMALILMPALDAAEVKEAATVSIIADRAPGRAAIHGLEKLKLALREKGVAVREHANPDAAQGDILIVVGMGQGSGAAAGALKAAGVTPPAAAESMLIRNGQRQGKKLLTVCGADDRGLMYALLDVAEQIRLGTPLEGITSRTIRACFPFRAIKFNLPFAGYRNSPAIEQHQETVRDLAFWESFLDMMAENRFNTLTLWSLHPFHYLVVPKSFPEAQSFSDAELAGWRVFYTKLFALARERGIETYLINWNTFVSPAFARAHGIAEYSLEWDFKGEGPKDKTVRDYTRECVQQTIDEYPDLTGLGITLGERMGGQTPAERREWLDETFFAGIQAAHRPIKFIYRAPLSADTRIGGSTSVDNDQLTRTQIESLGGNVRLPVYVEFKYNWSHGHSSSRLHIVHGGKLSDAYWNPLPKNYQPVWTVRNEDFLVLRWGEPGFIREFIANNGQPYVGGALLGSECFIPAKDSISLDGPWKSGRYAFERQWLWYALWGRLLYEPDTPDSVFAAQLGARFGREQGGELLTAWTLASRVPLRFASFHRGTVDRSLYTEAFSRWEAGGSMEFFDINEFIDHPVLDPLYVNIHDFVAAGGRVAGAQVSPLQLAARLDEDCSVAGQKVAAIRARGSVSPKLEAELADLEAWNAYGHYFAAKLRGGVALATFRVTHDVAQQEKAVAELTAGVGFWKTLAEAGARYNKGNILFGTSVPMSWRRLLPAVEQDVELAKGPPNPGAKE
jgi:hypothetical protein